MNETRTEAVVCEHVTVQRSDRDATPATLLDGVNWTVRAGEHWVVLGPNGAGKSTLLSLAGAVERPTTGTVRVLGLTIGRADMRDLRERIGLVDAKTARSFRATMQVLQVVLTGAFGSIALQRKRLHEEHLQAARNWLELVGAEHLAERRLETCSQGERQRVLLARALMSDPELILLDEPATGLDLPSRERLISALAASAASNPQLPTVTVTHHLEEIPTTCTHALLLSGGRVLTAGPVEHALSSEAVSECFEIPVEILRRNGRWSAFVNAPPGDRTWVPHPAAGRH